MQEKSHVHRSFFRTVDLGILNLNQVWRSALENFFPLCVFLSCQRNVKCKANSLWCYAAIFPLAYVPYYLIKCHQTFHCQTKTFVFYFYISILYAHIHSGYAYIRDSGKIRGRNTIRITFFRTFYDCGLSIGNLMYSAFLGISPRDHQD